MNTQLLITILLTVVGVNFINFIVIAIVAIRWVLWKRKNNLDITILELTKNGIIARKEIGRQELSKHGWRIVTAKFMSNRVKDNLGYKITQHDMLASGHGNKRKYLLVAMKDGLASALDTAAHELELTEEELKLWEQLREHINTSENIKITEIPKTLSLKPILAEQTRLAIDLARDTVDVEGADDKKAARRMVYIAIGLFVFAMLIILVMFVIMITQGPDAASAVTAKQAASSAVSVAPGINLPG